MLEAAPDAIIIIAAVMLEEDEEEEEGWAGDLMASWGRVFLTCS